MFEYYFAKRANIALLDEQLRALPWAAGRGFAGSAWLDPSLTPEAGKSLRCSYGRVLTTAQEAELGTVVTAHDASQKTQAQIDHEAAAAADTAAVIHINDLGALCRAGTATPEQVRELAGLMEGRLF